MPVLDEYHDTLLTLDEAALYLKCSKDYLRRLVALKKLAPRVIAGKRFFAAAELRVYRRDHAQLGQRRKHA